jgi:serine/threonine protein kinase
MEFVDGEDLDQKIIGNKLTPNDWRQVVTACSSALDYVHKRGVVHRDIKPSNILVDSEGRVKIGDFGIAHIIGGDTLEEGEDESTPRGTGANRAVGTAHYMAPEQMNDPSHIDHRADIFSLAVAFYKMMTRQLPIGEFPAPSEANPEIPVAVDEVIFRALSYSRDDRHQSVQEFCDQLSKALKDQTVSITSILNYRSRTPVSTLYSGADFSKTSSPAGSSSSEVKKPKSDTGIRKNTTGTGTTGASKRGSSTTNAKKPKMGSGRVTVSSDLTPLPVDPSSGANPTVKAPAKGNKTLLVIVAVLLISGLGLLAAVVLNGNERNTAAAPVEPPPPGEIKSEAILREERLEKAREEKRKELLRGSITGDTTQSTPASNQ